MTALWKESAEGWPIAFLADLSPGKGAVKIPRFMKSLAAAGS